MVRPLISSEFSEPPLKVCGKVRESLETMTGSFGARVPTFSTLFEMRSLPVRPKSPKLSCARPVSRSRCSRPVPLRSGLESSFRPRPASASTPTPTKPSVKPDSYLRMKPWDHSSCLAWLGTGSLAWRKSRL
ncbi:hypothetical protein D3C78_523790 [compost metagenome]